MYISILFVCRDIKNKIFYCSTFQSSILLNTVPLLFFLRHLFRSSSCSTSLLAISRSVEWKWSFKYEKRSNGVVKFLGEPDLPKSVIGPASSHLRGNVGVVSRLPDWIWTASNTMAGKRKKGNEKRKKKRKRERERRRSDARGRCEDGGKTKTAARRAEEARGVGLPCEEKRRMRREEEIKEKEL